ncbi:metallophosphoesterase [Egicoccus sp. AB-alg6-2]|uniref:metallophosphoesterase n=1 Tax=Egicoccus sp. AB-alg6-2 TaxID=3242692 RepID=UPI00359EFBD5
MTPPPPRPTSTDPEALGFEMASMVEWLSPRELIDTGQRAVLSGLFGAYADKRELLGALGVDPPQDVSDRAAVWIDYVADLGDGFDATYSVASLLAAGKLDVAGVDGQPTTTTRGDVLVMGGDQVYPSASVELYEQRLVGPYGAALPYTVTDHPTLYAIPGNHDWYDGLTAFLRVFGQGRFIGGWQTRQRRSYFAVQLPHRWWLWGLDIQFETYIDAPQLDYFRRIAEERMQAGDEVVLCSAKPTWVGANTKEPESYAHLDFFERHVLTPVGARVRVALSGDAHHYVRYTEIDGDRQKITAGGGGAYLSATHRLPPNLELPPAASRARGKTTPSAAYRMAATYPDRETSQRLRWRVGGLPFDNRGFWRLVTALHAWFSLAVLWWARSTGAGLTAELRDLTFGAAVARIATTPAASVVTALILFGMLLFTKDHRWRWRLGLGLPHGIAHVLVAAGTITLAANALSRLPDALYLPAFVVASGIVGGLASCYVFAGYLLLADTTGHNTNELFAAARIEDHKCFVRLHVAEEALTVYAIGVPKVAHRWRVRAGASPEDSWLEPDGDELEPQLIEAPIRLERGVVG